MIHGIPNTHDQYYKLKQIKKDPFPHNKFMNLAKMVIFLSFNLKLLQNLTC